MNKLFIKKKAVLQIRVVFGLCCPLIVQLAGTGCKELSDLHVLLKVFIGLKRHAGRSGEHHIGRIGHGVDKRRA
jgi:hypothetical protein